MRISKFSLIAIIMMSLAAGFGVASWQFNIKAKSTSPYTTSTTNEIGDQLKNLEADSLQLVLETGADILKLRAPSLIDSLVELGKVKDTLLVAATKLEMLGRNAPTAASRTEMKLALEKVESLISVCNETLMKGATESLRPTNTALKQLLKQMGERTEKLRSLSGTIAAITEVVTALTNILSTSILAPVAAL